MTLHSLRSLLTAHRLGVVETQSGQSIFVIYDAIDDGSWGEVTSTCDGPPGACDMAVYDDPAETEGYHFWFKCCTDGFATHPLDPHTKVCFTFEEAERLQKGILFYELDGEYQQNVIKNGLLDTETVEVCITLGIPMDIDVQPGDDIGCLNIDGTGKIPIAIYGSEFLDVTEIVLESLDFNTLKVYEKNNGKLQCSTEDLNEDGYLDLICHFEDTNTGVWETTDATTGTVTGLLNDGTTIEGTDTICVVKVGGPKHHLLRA